MMQFNRRFGAGCQCMDAYFCLVFVLMSSFCPVFVLIWSHLCPVPVLCPVFDSFLSTLISILSQSGLVSVIADSVLSPFCPVLSLNFLENLGDKFQTKPGLNYFLIFYLVTLQLDRMWTIFGHQHVLNLSLLCPRNLFNPEFTFDCTLWLVNSQTFIGQKYDFVQSMT